MIRATFIDTYIKKGLKSKSEFACPFPHWCMFKKGLRNGLYNVCTYYLQNMGYRKCQFSLSPFITEHGKIVWRTNY